jgi:6-phosphogluconate dehydrogenase
LPVHLILSSIRDLRSIFSFAQSLERKNKSYSIRAQFLQKIKDAYDNNPELENLLLDPYFKNIVTDLNASW